jgi:hypothetical protein
VITIGRYALLVGLVWVMKPPLSFHSMATIRYRKNNISSLLREDGSLAVDHIEKAGLLWNSF